MALIVFAVFAALMVGSLVGAFIMREMYRKQLEWNRKEREELEWYRDTFIMLKGTDPEVGDYHILSIDQGKSFYNVHLYGAGKFAFAELVSDDVLIPILEAERRQDLIEKWLYQPQNKPPKQLKS